MQNWLFYLFQDFDAMFVEDVETDIDLLLLSGANEKVSL